MCFPFINVYLYMDLKVRWYCEMIRFGLLVEVYLYFVVPDCHRTSNYRISFRSADRQMGTTWCPSCMCSWRYQGERTDNCRYAWPQHLCGTCHRIPHPHCEFERIIIDGGIFGFLGVVAGSCERDGYHNCVVMNTVCYKLSWNIRTLFFQ